MAKVPLFSELIAATTTSAVHLEMRDAYTPDDQRFLDWLAGKPLSEPVNPAWYELVRVHAARGVQFRRARIVSEPLADFIRFEHAITPSVNIAAGEQVRWLPRRHGLAASFARRDPLLRQPAPYVDPGGVHHLR
jgi:hypothetical protein